MCSLRNSSTGSRLWEVPFLDEGVSLIHSLNPYGNIAVHSLQTGTASSCPLSADCHVTMTGIPSGQTRPPVSELAAEVMFSNALFWAHPELLPRAGPAALSTASFSRTSPFTPAEDK